MHRIVAVLVCLAACATPRQTATNTYVNTGAGAVPVGGTDDTGQVRNERVDQLGNLFELPGFPSSPVNCIVAASSTANAVCQAPPDAGTIYVTGYTFTAGATALSVHLEGGDGGTCGYQSDALTVAVPVPANSSASKNFQSPIQVPSGQSLCCFTSGTTAFGCEVDGYVK